MSSSCLYQSNRDFQIYDFNFMLSKYEVIKIWHRSTIDTVLNFWKGSWIWNGFVRISIFPFWISMSGIPRPTKQNLQLKSFNVVTVFPYYIQRRQKSCLMWYFDWLRPHPDCDILKDFRLLKYMMHVYPVDITGCMLKNG